MHNYNIHASVTAMLQHLHLPTLQQRSEHFKIIMLYKITHQLANIPTATYITVIPSTRTTQHHILAYACTRVLKTYVFPSTINIWNNHQRVISTAQRCHNLGKHCKPYHNRIGVCYTFSWGSIDTPHLLASSPIRIYITK